MPSIAGITWERLQREGAVTYPCETEGDPGESVIFASRFPTPSGKSKLVPADVIPGAEQPDVDYPFVLITGRQLEHWHTGAMTRRASMLDALEPAPTVYMHPLDYEAVGAHGKVTIRSRRGQITLRVRVDEGTPRGAVFVPFAYYEAAANLLTNPALDPFGKIPEFKYCAVAVVAETG
jgi:formate dehydrogenase major subunit